MGQTPRMLVFCAGVLAGCVGKAGARQGAGSTVSAVDAGRSPAAVPVDPFAFDPAFFEKKRKPKAGDWLAAFPEPGQSFTQYVAQGPKGLTSQRTVIVLQPIGRFSADELAVLERLREFASAYFQLRVRVEKAVPLPDHGKRERGVGSMAWTQYHTRTLMAEVLLPRLPDDAVCYLGITMADLYPEPSWNFVFGEASFTKRVAVYSLVRYTNRFWGRPETERSRSRFLQRSFKVLAHETGHMFTLAHCTANECLMNGSVCLHKLQWNLKFDVLRHYRQLHAIYQRSGYVDFAEWTQRRITSLAPGPEANLRTVSLP
jgi:archaemetzincin